MSKIIVPVILCGGSGSRLWPASREQHPKQFLPLVDDRSLLQNTMERALRVANAKPEHLVTVTSANLAGMVREQLSAIDPAAAKHVLCEPSARNTAAAVAYAAVYVRRVFGRGATLWILPADHYIGNEEEMATAFRSAMDASSDGRLATFGIKPTRAETGYGYIRLGPAEFNGVHRAEGFVEKPDLATAQKYVAEGNYLWNSGMFLFSVDTLILEYIKHAGEMLRQVAAAMDKAPDFTQPANDLYDAIPSLPFDKAIMEKSSRVAVVPCNPLWSDIGSWESLWELRAKDVDGNAIAGDAVLHGTRDCLIQGGTKLIACAGVEDLVVIDTGDALLVAKRSDSDSLRSLVKMLKARGYPQTAHMPVMPEVISRAGAL
ncbi:MAG: mannose-1-phosphate guanylyltransferase [Alphaproteobacteria bacterium]